MSKLTLVGRTFDRLTVLLRAGVGSGGAVFWLCRCTCGQQTRVKAANLLGGRTRSCGCLQKELVGARSLRHGEGRERSPEYMAWNAMLSRCTNARHPSYARYGGRGITVDYRWYKFENFLEDMGRRPGPGFSIERVKNHEGYAKNNCVWATRCAQANNRSTHRVLTLAGRTQTTAQWATELGLPPSTLRNRIQRGWPLERALVAHA